jgi:polysaccharide pyruvyl transferase WcaK-like protein
VKKILVCAVPFSDNLGDGVIHEVLAQLLRGGDAGVTVSALDLAGRRGHGEATLKRAVSGLLLPRLPAALRQAAVLGLFGAKYLAGWRRRWRSLIDESDLVVVGGGQLFSDVDLNFPYKLFLLGRLLRGKPCAVLFVGVASRWSRLGRALVRRFIADARPVAWVVRDARSRDNLARELGVDAAAIRVAPDPVVCLGRGDRAPRATPGSRRVGVCVSDPGMLAHSGTPRAAAGDDAEAYRALVEGLVRRGVEVVLFTNGAREDGAYLAALRRRFPSLARLDAVVPARPEQLVAVIASCGLVVAHRMHANIIAYALGVPSIGLAWDDKVRSFFAAAGRDELVVDDLADPRLFALLDRLVAGLGALRTDPAPLAGVVEAEIAALRARLGGAPA